MTLTETITPTRERLAKGKIEHPMFDQSTRRPYHRAVHKFEDLYQNGKINEGCFEAGSKLMRHHYGALGINVSSGDGANGQDCMEYPQSYHAQMLAKAQKHVDHADCWAALSAMIEETRTLPEIGEAWLGCRDKARAYIAGLALVSMGLQRLSTLWGFSQSYHDRNPPSR